VILVHVIHYNPLGKLTFAAIQAKERKESCTTVLFHSNEDDPSVSGNISFAIAVIQSFFDIARSRVIDSVTPYKTSCAVLFVSFFLTVNIMRSVPISTLLKSQQRSHPYSSALAQ
jgi:hypothetical protein